MLQKSIGRKGLIALWLGMGFTVASYYNACGGVKFDQSSSARLNDMQSSASIVINNNDNFTKSDLVSVQLTSFQSDEVYLTNDATCASGGTWQPLTANMNWTLGLKNQESSVYAKYRNTQEGLETSCVSDSIVHDDIAPMIVLNMPTVATNVPTPIVNFVASDALSGIDKQVCQWPGQAAASCDGATSNGNLGEGRYLVQVSAIDRAGNASTPITQDLIVDRTPPQITILSAPPASGNNPLALYGFTATDDRAGVKSVECSWENQTAYAACVSPVSRTVTEGPHVLFIRATDVAGNMVETRNTFIVDTSAPTVRILTGPVDNANLATATFTFDGNDNGVAITQFDCKIDAGAFANCTSPKAYTALGQGLHTFTVRGYDAAGNLSSPVERKWFVDMTAPLVTFISVPLALSNNPNAVFKYTITDSASGVDKALCSLDAGAFTACPVDGISYAGLTAGDHKFQVRAIDKAGNSGDSSLVNFTIDLTAPVIQFTATPNTLSNLAAFQFKFSATDSSGIDHVECRLDAAAYATCDSSTSQQISGLVDGGHKFSVRAFDKAGNPSIENTYNWTVDLTPPTISYLQMPSSVVAQGVNVVVNFTAADAGSGIASVACKLDGTMVACQSGTQLTIQAPATGAHAFVVTAMDKAGNSLTDTKAFTVSPAVLKNQQVEVKKNSKVDVLVIMDNSGSMADEMTNMATRVSSFVSQLNGLDWQIGVITTDVDNDNALKDGRLVELKNMPGQYVLNSSMSIATAQNAFAATVQMATTGSGNELGMKASIRAMQRAFDTTKAVNAPNQMLFRPDAALAVVVVSDAYDNSGTKAEDVIATVKSYWPTKAFAWHSIVVPNSSYTNPAATAVNPADPCAKSRESVQYDGREYLRLSGLTGGIQGNECLADYGAQLKDMGQSTAELVNSVTLDCQPLDHNGDGKVDAADVVVTDASGATLSMYTLQGTKLTFTNTLPVGVNKVQYYCAQ